ncbi:dihydrofolate reductase [Dissophora globulifera]|nr:dihydrofolate reductase [Dissophora globulifera]
MQPFSIVVAADLANGIGLNGTLPWRLRKDMAFFARITSKVFLGSLDQTQDPSTDNKNSLVSRKVNACIMGRRTWESIPQKFRPLINRFNIIVSRDPHYLDDKPERHSPLVALATSFEYALELARSKQPSQAAAAIAPAPPSLPVKTSDVPDIEVQRIFLIGGAQLYDHAIHSEECSHIFLTRIQSTLDCDTFFPKIMDSEYKLLPGNQSHQFLEEYLQEPVEGGLIEEGQYKYEYTVYNRI